MTILSELLIKKKLRLRNELEESEKLWQIWV